MTCSKDIRSYGWKSKLPLKIWFLGCKGKLEGRRGFEVLCLRTLEQNLSLRCLVALLDPRGAQHCGWSHWLSTVMVSCRGTQGELGYQPCFQHTRSMFSSASGVVMLIQCHNLGLSQVSAEHCQCFFSLAVQWLYMQKGSGEENILLKIGCS